MKILFLKKLFQFFGSEFSLVSRVNFLEIIQKILFLFLHVTTMILCRLKPTDFFLLLFADECYGLLNSFLTDF